MDSGTGVVGGISAPPVLPLGWRAPAPAAGCVCLGGFTETIESLGWL